jgi:glycosyltransferase involved in cell wall biosynthesis/VanZ family protein
MPRELKQSPFWRATKAVAPLFFLLLAGLAYALNPVGNRGRNTWLPGKWAEWIDQHDWGLNFLAFALLAAAIVVALGRRRPALYRMLLAAAAGVLLAAGIETAQLRIPGRNADPEDLWAAGFGAAVGGFVAFFHGKRQVRVQTARSGTPARICFVDQTGQLGGAELMLLDLAAAFRDRCEVVLFQDGPFREELETRGVACHVEPLAAAAARIEKSAKWSSGLAAIPGVIAATFALGRRFRDADLAYTNTAKALLVGALAARLANRPLIHHLHDIVDAEHFSGFNRFLLIRTANWGAEQVIANSEATERAFVRAGGCAKRVRVIPNGFDLARFAGGAQGAATVRAEWEVGNRIVFGVFGRLTEWKGQDLFLEALARTPEAMGVIVGAALFTEEDLGFEERLRRRAAEADLAGRVVFTGFRADVIALMRAVDVVVHCSRRAEPFGRVIVEAQLCGKPVIAAGAGGAAEIVQDGATGKLVRPDDVDALWEAMTWMRAHPEEREALGRRAEEEARERYDLSAVIRNTEDLVKAVTRGVLSED